MKMNTKLNLNQSNGTEDETWEQINLNYSKNASMLKQVIPKKGFNVRKIVVHHLFSQELSSSLVKLHFAGTVSLYIARRMEVALDSAS
jgi:hypothetical protein